MIPENTQLLPPHIFPLQPVRYPQTHRPVRFNQQSQPKKNKPSNPDRSKLTLPEKTPRPVRYTQKSQPKEAKPHNPDRSKPNFPEETSKPVRFNQQPNPEEANPNKPDKFT